MRNARIICFIHVIALTFSGLMAQETKEPQFKTTSDKANVRYDPNTGDLVAEGGVEVRYQDGILTADSATYNKATGQIHAEGHVRIERAGQVWIGDKIDY
ncbi:MAG: hypothetical protein HYR88_05540, partial [Verrucomicrobia bacterium]|nr:hypothetical protein [Verrucomicrobiota bacterium]